MGGKTKQKKKGRSGLVLRNPAEQFDPRNILSGHILPSAGEPRMILTLMMCVSVVDRHGTGVGAP